MNNLSQIVLCPNPLRDEELKTTLSVKDKLEQAGYNVIISPVSDKKHGSHVDGIETVPFETVMNSASLYIVFGGDGSILSVARNLTEYDVPIIGVNMGHIGFMADLDLTQTDLLLDAARGNCAYKTRLMLDVKLIRNGQSVYNDCALNEAVVSGTVSAISVSVYGDGSKISEFQGDGVIVATPTGSTAYSLSAGGPLVEPTADNIILTPICAHIITVLPYVLVSNRMIQIFPVVEKGKDAWISVDGEEPIPIFTGDEIQISKSKNTTTFAKVSDKSFYDVVYEKLGGRP